MKLLKASFTWALQHVLRFGDTDIFPAPFEYKIMESAWGALLPQLLAFDMNEYQTREHRRALTPKSRYGFRLATELDPMDTLMLAATVYEIAKDLEANRIPAKDRVVMSHRVKRQINGQLYDPKVNFEAFKAVLRERCANAPYSWVVTTDIADFYTRIYHHRLENALRLSTKKADHVNLLMRLLGQWNDSVSYGIPVGPAPTRILAEIAINDVDDALVGEGIEFCRFSDDFRLFAPNERSAFQALAFLANYLQQAHGLTLSERKTDIVPAARFVSRHLEGTRAGDSAVLSERVGQILEKYAHTEDAYAALAFDDIPEGMVRELDELDLNSVLQSQIGDHRMFDAFSVSIALRRLAQLRDETLLDFVVARIDQLTPILPQVVNFIEKVTPAERKQEVGARLLESIDEGISGHQEFHQAWLLGIFTKDDSWGNGRRLLALQQKIDSAVSRPTLIQALGKAKQRSWFLRMRGTALNMGGWERRAFIEAAQCLAGDEYTHWLRSLLPRLTDIEQLVAKDCLTAVRRR